MYFWIVPSSRMLRVMLSSHRLWPRAWRVSVAFTVLPPVVSWRLSRPGRGHAIAREGPDGVDRDGVQVGRYGAHCISVDRAARMSAAGIYAARMCCPAKHRGARARITRF